MSLGNPNMTPINPVQIDEDDNGYLIVTRRFRVNRVELQSNQTNYFDAPGTVDGATISGYSAPKTYQAYSNCVLTTQSTRDGRGKDYAEPEPNSENCVIEKVYKQATATLTQYGPDNYDTNEDGITAITQTLIQATTGTYTPLVVGTATYGGGILAEEKATLTVAIRTVNRRYVVSGLVQAKVEMGQDGTLKVWFQSIGVKITPTALALAWNSGTAYKIGDVAYVLNDFVYTYYIAIAPSTNHTPPNATYWTNISSSTSPYTVASPANLAFVGGPATPIIGLNITDISGLQTFEVTALMLANGTAIIADGDTQSLQYYDWIELRWPGAITYGTVVGGVTYGLGVSPPTERKMEVQITEYITTKTFTPVYPYGESNYAVSYQSKSSTPYPGPYPSTSSPGVTTIDNSTDGYRWCLAATTYVSETNDFVNPDGSFVRVVLNLAVNSTPTYGDWATAMGGVDGDPEATPVIDANVTPAFVTSAGVQYYKRREVRLWRNAPGDGTTVNVTP